MSRPLRIEFPDALYHVTSRGDRREDIFEDDDDRRAFLGTLAQVVAQFNCICYAWCLMDNHYHLLVQTPEGNLSKGMRQLNGVYTQASNGKWGQGKWGGKWGRVVNGVGVNGVRHHLPGEAAECADECDHEQAENAVQTQALVRRLGHFWLDRHASAGVCDVEN
jgi:REP element-mobilizing transposase RayT